MSARPQEAIVRPALRVIEGGEAASVADPRRVVAEILSDGTIRQVGALGPEAEDGTFATGKVAGDGWTVWWDRRRWR